MNNKRRSLMGQAIAVAVLVLVISVASVGRAGPPTLSTNPGKHVIFPAKGQTAEQQKLDEAAAYDWACEQTSWDPYQGHGALVAEENAAGEVADSASGRTVKRAAGGALLGVAIGAIAGDAGKGAAIGAAAGGITGGASSYRTRKSAGDYAGAAAADYKAKFEIWDRNFVAAMEGKGYTVN